MERYFTGCSLLIFLWIVVFPSLLELRRNDLYLIESSVFSLFGKLMLQSLFQELAIAFHFCYFDEPFEGSLFRLLLEVNISIL